MPSSITCRACGHTNPVEASRAGKTIACGECGTSLAVPAASANGGANATTAMIKFACPSCGQQYTTKPDLAGKKIRCKGCGAGVHVPDASAKPAATPSKPALKTFGAPATSGKPAPAPAPAASGSSGEPSLLDDLAALEGVKRPRRAEEVLPSRSEVMEQVRQKAAEQKAAESEEKAEKVKKKKKKKKKKAAGYFDPKDTMMLVGGVGAFVGLVALFAWGYPGLRFPVGGFLCVVGFIVYLLGAASLRQLVAEEGAFKALLFRFFPPYQWWFVATHWEETRDFVAFFGAGLAILAIGGAVIKSSPVGKKAEASERAYQKARGGASDDGPPPVVSGDDDEG